MKNTFTSFVFSLLLAGIMLHPKLVNAIDNSPEQTTEPFASFTCNDMLNPQAFRIKQKEELKRWNTENSQKSLQAQSSSNDSGLMLWLAAHDTFRRSLKEARVEHRRQYMAACQTDEELDFSISPEFTIYLYHDSLRRIRVREPVLSRTVGNTGGSKITSATNRLRSIVQTGGHGIARSLVYLSARTRRATFRTAAPEGRPCSQSGKQARLDCAKNEY